MLKLTDMILELWKPEYDANLRGNYEEEDIWQRTPVQNFDNSRPVQKVHLQKINLKNGIKLWPAKSQIVSLSNQQDTRKDCRSESVSVCVFVCLCHVCLSVCLSVCVHVCVTV